jgi:hypothetical protein
MASRLLERPGRVADTEEIVAVPAHYPWRPLGELLVEKRLLHADDLEEALLEQRRTGRRLGEILVDCELISSADLTCVLTEQHGVRLEVVRADGPKADTRSAAPEPVADERWRPLGKLLLERELVSEEELERALADQRQSGRLLGEILVANECLSWFSLAAALAEQHGVKPPGKAELREASAPSPRQRAEAPVYEFRASGVARFRSESFLEATDQAFDALETGRESLTIVRITGASEAEVWRYDEELAEAAAEAAKSPLRQFGFDVTRWTGPAPYDHSQGHRD